LLLVSTMGMAATKHFCGDKLINIQVFETSSNEACCGDIPMDCCEDEQFTVAPLQLEIPLPSSPSVNPISKIIQTLYLNEVFTLTNPSTALSPIYNKTFFWQPMPDLQSLLSCYLI
jgi:hypothetical protein